MDEYRLCVVACDHIWYWQRSLLICSPGNLLAYLAASGLALRSAIGGYRLWPGIALGVFLGNYLADKSIESSLVFVIGNTFEPLVAIWLLKHRLKDANHRNIIDLRNLSDYFWLALAAILSISIGIVICIIGLFLINELSFGHLLSACYFVDRGTRNSNIYTFFLIWRKLPERWFEGYRTIETSFLWFNLSGRANSLSWNGSIKSRVYCSWLLVNRFRDLGAFVCYRIYWLPITFVQAMIGVTRVALWERFAGIGLINMQLAFLVVSVNGCLTLVICELENSGNEIGLWFTKQAVRQ